MPENNDFDYESLNYDSIVENCLSDEIKSTLPESWGNKFKGKSLNDIFKSHIELEKEMSRRVRLPDEKTSDEDRIKFLKSLGLPDENSTPESSLKFFRMLGCPEKPDDYDFTDIDFGENADVEGLKNWKKFLHDLGVSKNVGRKIAENASKIAMLKLTAQKAEKEKLISESEELLRKDWPGDSYNANLSRAQKFYETHFGEKAAKILQENNLHTNPEIVRGFYNLAEKTGDMTFVQGTPTGKEMTREEYLNQKFPDKTASGG